MSEIIKTCKVHGKLTRDQVTRKGTGWRCRQCHNLKERARSRVTLTESQLIEKISMMSCDIHGRFTLESIAIHGARIRCKACKQKGVRETYEIHKEKYAEKFKIERRELVNERLKEARKLNLEKFREYGRNKYHKNKQRILDLKAATMHDISLETYHDMLVEQDNKCMICKRPETRKSSQSNDITRLCVDHCHETGIVRGLLCHSCNTGLGKFEDNIPRMVDAIEYLISSYEKHQTTEGSNQGAQNEQD